MALVKTEEEPAVCEIIVVMYKLWVIMYYNII